MGLDLKLRQDFPLLAYQPDLVYLDSTATAQKPQAVLDALLGFYGRYNANVHRGAYPLSMEATAAFEAARERVARFIGAEAREVVFVRNATEALNLVAYSWGLSHLEPGDEILLTEMEHHANLVPWHLVAKRTGACIKAIPITPEGRLNLNTLEALLTPRVRLVGLVHMSNVLGTVNPVAQIAQAARRRGAVVVVDGAQSAPHLPIRVGELGADFFAFSGHKLGGPTGIGVLWGRHDLLRQLPPFLGGGEMIDEVFIERSSYADPPQRFEAGTPPIAEAVGLGAAVDYLSAVGMERIWQHDQALTHYALGRLEEELPEVRLYGPRGADRGGIVALNLGSLHPHDLASALEPYGIAVRAGHHCAQPLHRVLGVPATLRASFYFYTTQDDVDRLIEALKAARGFFKDWL